MTNYITSQGIQQFSITIGSSAVTGAVSINPVGSGAFILRGGEISPETVGVGAGCAYLSLPNSSTILATRNSIGTAGYTVTGCIVDGDTTNLIKSVQYGTISLGAGSPSGTASINPVTNNNTALHYLGKKTSVINETLPFGDFILSLSGTTVTATGTSSTGTRVVGFEVIEFQGSVLNQSVQNVSAITTGSVTSYSSSINSVNTNNTILIHGGANVATVTSNLAQAKQYASLANSTTVTVNVNTASANKKTFNCSVVEFVPGILTQNVQRGTTQLSGTSNNTSTITSSPTSQSAVLWLDNITGTTTGVLNQAFGDVVLTNPTTITVSKNSAISNITGSWEVATFPAFTLSSGNSIWFGAIA